MDAHGSPPQVLRLCATCVYWRRDQEGDSVAVWGQCRRMPPAVPPIEEEKLVHVGVWPHTQENDWCGEWSAGDGRQPTGAGASAA